MLQLYHNPQTNELQNLKHRPLNTRSAPASNAVNNLDIQENPAITAMAPRVRLQWAVQVNWLHSVHSKPVTSTVLLPVAIPCLQGWQKPSAIRAC